MKATPTPPITRLRDALRDAIEVRRLHTEQCLRWDYDQTDCEICDRHDVEVRAARQRLRRAIDAEVAADPRA